jgi:hypothetical protein
LLIRLIASFAKVEPSEPYDFNILPVSGAIECLTPSDKQGAWEMYVELTTKDATPMLNLAYLGSLSTGRVESALANIHSIAPETGRILKSYGSDGSTFAKLAISLISNELAPFSQY